MPLLRGSSKSVIQENIRKMISEGYPENRAVAAAYRQAGKSRKRNSKKSTQKVG